MRIKKFQISIFFVSLFISSALFANFSEVELDKSLSKWLLDPAVTEKLIDSSAAFEGKGCLLATERTGGIQQGKILVISIATTASTNFVIQTEWEKFAVEKTIGEPKSMHYGCEKTLNDNERRLSIDYLLSKLLAQTPVVAMLRQLSQKTPDGFLHVTRESLSASDRSHFTYKLVDELSKTGFLIATEGLEVLSISDLQKF
jgi:hypothetical protein